MMYDYIYNYILINSYKLLYILQKQFHVARQISGLKLVKFF